MRREDEGKLMMLVYVCDDGSFRWEMELKKYILLIFIVIMTHEFFEGKFRFEGDSRKPQPLDEPERRQIIMTG